MKIYTSINEAVDLFRRRSWEDAKPSPAVQKAIAEVFGRPMSVVEVVMVIAREVQRRGDAAVREFTKKIDKVDVEEPVVDRKTMYRGYRRLPDDLKDSLELAAQRIRAFHVRQMEHASKSFLNGGLGQKVTPLERVGIYVPGGTAAYPSTVLMTAIPARVAGVKEVIVATPPGKDGTISDAVLGAAYLAKVDSIFTAGGAQAIAAMAFGTRSVPRVDKICGPGNIFVVLAKKLVYGYTGIDGLAGPTETIVIADETADPAICAADLLAQAEHDVMASAILFTDSRSLADNVQKEIEKQLADLERKAIAGASVEQNGGIVLVDDLNEAVDLVNSYAPEHVSVMVKSPDALAAKIKNAGCIFVGENSAEAFGDYVAGPSHVLPTGGSARFTSALGVQEFLKVTGIVKLDKTTAQELAPATARFAEAEGLTAHARAARSRNRETEFRK